MTTSAPRAARVTPAAVLAVPARVMDADREHWLNVRRRYIGSSDVPRVLNLYPSPRRVWYDKRGELPDTDTEEKLWGRALEAAIAAEWTRRNRTVTTKVGMVRSIEHPLLSCTLDRRVRECPLNRELRNGCALEVKLTSVFRASRWRRTIPDDVLAQGLHQLRVTGYDHLHLAVLIGTSDYRQDTMRRDDERDVYDYVAAEVDRYAEQHMPATERPPPAVAEGEDPDLFDQVYPDRAGVKRLSFDDAITALEARTEYLDAHDAVVAATKRKTAAKAIMLDITGDAAAVVGGDNDALWTYPEVSGAPRVDLGVLHERYPAAYQATVTPTSHRTLMIPGRRSRKAPK